MPAHYDHLSLAIKLAFENVQRHGGRPFGAVLVKDGQVVSIGAT